MNKKTLETLYGDLSLQQLQQEYVKAQKSQDYTAMQDLSIFIKKKQEELNNSPFQEITMNPKLVEAIIRHHELRKWLSKKFDVHGDYWKD